MYRQEYNFKVLILAAKVAASYEASTVATVVATALKVEASGAAARAVTIIADLLPCFYAVTREAKYRNKSVAALPRW